MGDRRIAEACIFTFQFACEDFPDTRAVKEVHIFASGEYSIEFCI